MMAKWDEEEENIDVPPNTVSLHARASFETDILVNVEGRNEKKASVDFKPPSLSVPLRGNSCCSALINFVGVERPAIFLTGLYAFAYWGFDERTKDPQTRPSGRVEEQAI